MTGKEQLLLEIYHRLLDEFGPQHWWPADTPLEVIVGAILTQNTSWKNVEQAVRVLKDNELLDLHALGEVPVGQLASLIRSAGYYNQKAQKLKAFVRWVEEHWQGDLGRFLGQETAQLREELLGVRGIGPETADSILLYAANQPSFVVDAYTHRIFSRHGWVQEQISYWELQEFFMSNLQPDTALFQEYHALLVRTGHLFCRRKPRCEPCPLRGWKGE
ncbi:MAG TPA: endonuclease III domain-containing protein [Syntrophobacteraceae bacterium]|nr:endonuclease III domain-containing protein [Syntrophobacteraceae bacterium]